MKTISTGEPSTLGTYRKIALTLYGADSPAVKFFDNKIEEQGEDEEVIADEGQVLNLLYQLDRAVPEVPGPKVGGRVEIDLEFEGRVHHLKGTVITAVNWGGKSHNMVEDDWYIELTEDTYGYVYWKQVPDSVGGRRVSKLVSLEFTDGSFYKPGEVKPE